MIFDDSDQLYFKSSVLSTNYSSVISPINNLSA